MGNGMFLSYVIMIMFMKNNQSYAHCLPLKYVFGTFCVLLSTKNFIFICININQSVKMHDFRTVIERSVLRVVQM